MHAPVHLVAERMPPTVGVLEAVDAESCLLTTGADVLDAIAMHLALLDAEFTVLDPPELINRVTELADRLRRATAAARSPEFGSASEPRVGESGAD